MRVPQSFEVELSVLESKGVLHEIKPEKLCNHIVKTIGALRRVNLLVLSCCDGHQFMDITQRTKFCCEEAKRMLGVQDMRDDCFHWKTENGGPFVLSVLEIKTRVFRGEVDHVERNILASMDEGKNLKQVNVALLIGHCVCGKVKDIFTSPAEYSVHMSRAAERLTGVLDLRPEHVIIWLQAHRESGRHMYSIDRDAAEAQLAA